MADRSYEITPDALDELDAELTELEGAARTEMAERIRTARGWGDLSENAEYHAAKEAQAHLETKIARLRDRRRNAIVVQPGADAAGGAALGSTVVVRDEDADRETTYILSPATGADPTEGKLSIEAPLARALIGAKVGDVVEAEAPRGVRRLRVLNVS
jgi:transcription elongation factor GreA